MVGTNKQGQALGRKGAGSRARLLESASTLLDTVPAERLTASAIARTAGLASQTLYLYFQDVDELLLQLSRDASNDLAEVMAELEQYWEVATLPRHAERFVAAVYRHWDRNRPILNIRNFRADSGQENFLRIRNESALPVVKLLAGHIRATQAITERASVARAVVIFSAIERMASRYASVDHAQPVLDADDLKQAEADILMLMLMPGGLS